jgi:hypothetical protein
MCLNVTFVRTLRVFLDSWVGVEVGALFWDMMPSHWYFDSRCFEKLWWGHLQWWSASLVGHFDPRKWKHYFISKNSETITRWLFVVWIILFQEHLFYGSLVTAIFFISLTAHFKSMYITWILPVADSLWIFNLARSLSSQRRNVSCS